MELSTVVFKGSNGKEFKMHVYKTETAPVKGAVLLLHGMAEHYMRYEGFLTALAENGYDAYIYNHRGHGTDVKDANLGYFAKHKGYELVINDAVEALKFVKSQNRGNKLFLFGHSMGSLIGRNVIQRFDDIDGALFCGTGFQGEAMIRGGLFLSTVVTFFCGARHKSPLLNKIMFETEEYLRNCKRTKSDWLTKDEKIVDIYRADPYCGFICTASFYHDLIHITGTAKWGMAATRRNLPILLASGSDDPVGSYGKGIKACFEKYKELGFTDVSMKLYEGDRHELLNEFDKEQVIKDFIGFFDKN